MSIVDEIFYIVEIVLSILWGITLLVTILTYWWKGSLFLYAVTHAKKGNCYPDAKKNHNFVLLLPARNESRVIGSLLESIKKLDYPHENIRIIVGVESLDDPTCKIAQSYGAIIYLKKDLDKKGKGYIVGEMIDYANNELDFDNEAFLILDADNVLDQNYLKEMNKALDAGYEVAVGYRNTKNWETGWVSSCSGLTFTRFSTLENLGRTRFGATVQLSGTGFYITKNLIEKLGGWNFYTLTEDLELTVRLAIEGVKTAYVSNAIFYDEQPVKWSDSKNQRTRWVKGYSQIRKIYGKQLLKGIKSKTSNRLGCYDYYFQALPFAFFLASSVFAVLGMFISACLSFAYEGFWAGVAGIVTIILLLMLIYLGIILDTYIAIKIERERIKMSKKNLCATIFMNPFFLMAYVFISLKAFKNEVEWVPIEHTINKDYDEVTKVYEKNKKDKNSVQK